MLLHPRQATPRHLLGVGGPEALPHVVGISFEEPLRTAQSDAPVNGRNHRDDDRGSQVTANALGWSVPVSAPCARQATFRQGRVPFLSMPLADAPE
jgi:hypothetical protein